MAYDFNSLTKQANEAINRDKFYTDFEDVDPSKLHQITELTDWIRTKGKGSDVREVIAQLFERTWVEGIKEGNANMEVAKARGTASSLAERLDLEKQQLDTNTSNLSKIDNSKVDKNGSGQITWANLSQDAREQISGNKVAVVGKNSVSTTNIVDKSVTNEKLKGQAINLAFFPSGDGNPSFDVNTGLLDFNCKEDNAFVRYNNQNILIAKNTVLNLNSSIPQTAGYILINLTTGAVSATSIYDSYPADSATLATVRKKENGNYAFSGAMSNVTINGKSQHVRNTVVESIRLETYFNQPLKFDKKTTTLDFNSTENLSPVIFWDGNQRKIPAGVKAGPSSQLVQYPSTNIKIGYRLADDTAKLYRYDEKLPPGIFDVGNFTVTDNGIESSLNITSNNVYRGDEVVTFVPSSDGRPWYDAKRQRLNFNCLTDNAFVDYHNTRYQLKAGCYVDLSGVTSTAVVFKMNLTTGEVIADTHYWNGNTLGFLNIGGYRRYADGRMEFWGFECDVPSNSVSSRSGIRSIAHRGFNRIAPEHSEDAYLLAAYNGYDEWEGDVQFTSDGVPVMFHDPTINAIARDSEGNRLTTNIFVATSTYAELSAYDYGYYKHPYFKGVGLLKFEDLVSMARRFGVKKLHIELKNTFTREQKEKLIDIVKKYRMQDKISWSCFRFEELRDIADLDETAELAFLGGDLNDEYYRKIESFNNGKRNLVCSQDTGKSAAQIQTILDRGYEVLVWTVNDEASVNKYRNVAIDGYITDGNIDIDAVLRK